eukprot:m.25396 g.25396  ORF g.25396 m.25396 type:complete len:83 (+) comp8703_c0_seq1:419-667(+)
MLAAARRIASTRTVAAVRNFSNTVPSTRPGYRRLPYGGSTTSDRVVTMAEKVAAGVIGVASTYWFVNIWVFKGHLQGTSSDE